MRRSGHTAVTLVAAVTIVVIVGFAAVAWSTNDPADPASGTGVTVQTLSATGSHVSFETTLNLPGDRVMLGAELGAAGGLAGRAYFHRGDLDVSGPRLRVPAGMPVLVELPISPDCGLLADADPFLSVRSELGDGTVTDTFEVSNPGEVDEAVRGWCTSGVTAQQVRTAWYADSKEAEINLQVTNPGPGPVTVTLDGWTTPDGARWLSTSVAVPAGATSTRIVVRGVNVRCADVNSFWRDQHLTATEGNAGRQVLTLDNQGGC